MEPLKAHAREIRRLLDEVRAIASRTAVVLVIGVKGVTRLRRDYDGYSVSSSFLLGPEIDDFIGSLRDNGFFVRHFADETEFLAWVLSGGYHELPHEHKLVYTSAVNGTGPARRSLIPSFCALEGVPTVNSDAYSCAINRHKFHWNRLLKEFGFRVPRTWWFDAVDGWFQEDRPNHGRMVIAKSTFEGSSLGVSSQTCGEFSAEIEQHIAEASRALRQPMTVQEFIAGDELEVPVLELRRYVAPAPVAILKANGVRTPDQVLSYAEVWEDAYRFAEPVGYTDWESAELGRIAVDAARTLGFRGFSRIDFRVDERRRPFIMDVSSTPHLTRASSYAFLFSRMGFSYAEMLTGLVAVGAKRHSMI